MIPVITISNHRPSQSYYCYDEFFGSCQRQGIQPVVLSGPFNGLISKPKLLQAHLEGGSVNEKHIIVTDCWDIVFLNTPEQILEKYLTFDSPIVFNGEKACWPRADLIPQFDAKYPDVGPSSAYRYLNSGFFVGEVEAILTLLRSMRLDEIRDDYVDSDGAWHHTNDQDNYQVAFCAQPVKMEIDTKASITQILHNIPAAELEFGEDAIRNILTGSTPSVLHANGGGKTDGVLGTALHWMLKKGLLNSVTHRWP